MSGSVVLLRSGSVTYTLSVHGKYVITKCENWGLGTCIRHTVKCATAEAWLSAETARLMGHGYQVVEE